MSGLDDPWLLVMHLDSEMEAETEDCEPDWQTRAEAFLIRGALQKPLALAVIGGLSFSTLFTLLFAPLLYIAIRRWQSPTS